MNTRPSDEPSRDELLAMAYADGELDAAARRDLDRRMADEPALALAVARYQRLEVLARRVVPPEPMDHQWRRLDRDPVQRASLGLGWILLALAALGTASWCIFELLRADLEPLPKILTLALVLGVLLLFFATLRARLKTLPYDPYLEVER
jgi:anti-sigma factor RsiW